MDWATNVHFEGADGSVTQEWKMVRSWDSFVELFEPGVQVEAVTYAETPEIFLELLEDYNFDRVDVMIGGRNDFSSAVDSISTARELEQAYRQGNLIIRMTTGWTVHSKLYRIVNDDGTVTLIAGSANFSKTGWSQQTNSIVVYRTESGSFLDTKFQMWIADHVDTYSHEIFIEDLANRLAEIDEEDERERIIELWIDNRTNELGERGEVHSDIGNELHELGEQVDQAVTNSKTSDELAEVGDDDNGVNEGGSVGIEPVEAESTEAVSVVRTPDYKVRVPSQDFDSDHYAVQMANELSGKGVTTGEDAISIPIDTYTEYLTETYDEWEMRVNEETEKVHLQIGEEHRILSASGGPTFAELDSALENIEQYIETVDEWGRTNYKRDVMAHMYEGVLYAMWAPFINQYAAGFYDKESSLDKALPHLFIYGPSDAGKDQFTNFLLQLLSDGIVEEGADGDNLTLDKIRALRQIDTCFPFVVSDVTKNRIDSARPLRNFWDNHWRPDLEMNYPAMIFTSNDSRPKEEFRNRAKMLQFSVRFPANPEEDKEYHNAQQSLNSITGSRNPIVSFVSRRMLRDRPFENPKQTIGDVRQMFVDFYRKADREIPDYFPEEGPAEVHYNYGKRRWRNAYRRGDVTFSRPDNIDNQLIAEFEDSYEVHKHIKILPKRMMASRSGRSVVIKDPDEFLEWLDEDIPDGQSLLGRLLHW